jgi:hypothetical protein
MFGSAEPDGYVISVTEAPGKPSVDLKVGLRVYLFVFLFYFGSFFDMLKFLILASSSFLNFEFSDRRWSGRCRGLGNCHSNVVQ